MHNEIVYKEHYINESEVIAIKDYYKRINDALSGGPWVSDRVKLGYQGCWDKSLHLDQPSPVYSVWPGPVHALIKKLKQDFGNFYIHMTSIRYLAYPLALHSDIRDVEWLLDVKSKGYIEGYTFLIPLWFDKKCNPGTAFFNNPAKLSEPHYTEAQDVLPEMPDNSTTRNFSVKKIVNWNNPGDLIAWKNFQWHCSTQSPDYQYSTKKHCKEFISIETFRKVTTEKENNTNDKKD